MFKFVLAVALVGFAAAASIDSDVHAEIKLFTNDIEPDGNYAYAYETTNGIAAQEAGNENGAHGDFAYVSPEGIPIKLVYTADIAGFQPQGAHLAPQLIRALDWIRAHPSPEGAIYRAQPQQYRAQPVLRKL